jgi:hypothetical protein
VAGVEILLCSNRGDLLEELVSPLVGYQSRGGPPEVVHHFTVRDDLCGLPSSRPYPAYDCMAESPLIYAFSRRDSRGHVHLPVSPGEPVRGQFDGPGSRAVLESTLRLSMCLALPRIGGLMLHASGATTQTRAFVFLGKSGAGKSTLFRQLQDGGSLGMLGDEMLVVRRDPQSPTEWMAYATPFGGECGPSDEAWAPLCALYFLRKSAVVRARPMPPLMALPELLQNVLAYVAERDAAERVLSLATQLLGAVPSLWLEFRKEVSTPGVADVLDVT